MNQLGLEISACTCEYTENPLGLSTPQPRFSWALDSATRGVTQSAYQIIVASSPEKLSRNAGDKWDSGQVNSDRSLNVPYQGTPLSSAERCWWKVRVWATSSGAGESDWSEPAWFEMGLLQAEEWQGEWIGASSSIPAPLLRKTFELAGSVRRARLYVSGLGWSETYLNGHKVSDRVLDPCTSEYDERVYYVVHDVTEQLQRGPNVIGLWLGNGWYSEPESSEGWSTRSGDSPRALVQLNIEMADGTTVDVASDTTWRTAGSCITQNDFYYGERYDARLEIAGWSEPDFDDTSWVPAEQKKAPGGVLHAQIMPPIRITRTLKAQRVAEPKPGVYVYDFGQLFGGWIRLRVTGPSGARVAIKYSEWSDAASGLIDTRRHKPPRATDYYVLRGDPEGETYEPRFTYHPVRYVQIEGAPCRLGIDSVDGCVVHTDEHLAGGFESDHALANQIHQNVTWTLTNGLFGMPLDCLYREHWAWTDPATITGSLYPRKYMPRFWTKWLRDIADTQREDGMVPVICPSYRLGDWDAAWGGNYAQLVWYLYQYYGDERMLVEHYDGIKRVVDYMSRTAEDGIITEGAYGDHMLPGSKPGEEEFVSSETPRELVWTGYFYRAAFAVSQVAAELGKESDESTYAALAGDIRRAFNDRWLDAEKQVYATGSQTAQVFPLAIDIVPPEAKENVINCLIQSITEQHGDHHHTGNTGTTCLIDRLPDLGHGEVLWRIVTNTTYPGWGYMVEQGATTIWESWSRDSRVGNAESMIMWATVDEFFYNDLAGIRGPEYYGRQAMAPGFKEIRIEPFVPQDLNAASASIRTGYGLVSSSWQKTSNGIELVVEIPTNTRAKVGVPKLERSNVTISESGSPVWQDGAFLPGIAGITGAAEHDDSITFDTGSGQYRFVLTGLEETS